MNFDLRPFIALWILMAIMVIALIIWRKMVASHEDDTLHVLQAGPVPQQAAVANRLDMIDKWGKILTVIAVVFGLLVGAAYVYQVWIQSSQIPTGV